MLTADQMERVIRRYYDGCNAADVAKMADCFTPDAVHYFPPGMPGGPFRGARTIAESWRQVVQKAQARWTIDALLLDPATGRAVIEWSNFTQGRNALVRGTEWVEFDRDSGLDPGDPRLPRGAVAARAGASATGRVRLRRTRLSGVGVH